MKANVPTEIVAKVKARVASVGLTLNEAEFAKLLAYVWPSLQKMQRRDEKLPARERAECEASGLAPEAKYCHRCGVSLSAT